MKYCLLAVVAFFCLIGSWAFADSQKPTVLNPKFAETIDRTIADIKAPLIGVNALHTLLQNDQKKPVLYLIDSREKKEFSVSRIAGAVNFPYDSFTIDDVDLSQLRGKTVIVYCSIGYRSGKIAEALRAAGVKSVFNLYGGIFEWSNRGLPLVDAKGLSTKQVHAYSRSWGKWIDKGEKVFPGFFDW